MAVGEGEPAGLGKELRTPVTAEVAEATVLDTADRGLGLLADGVVVDVDVAVAQAPGDCHAAAGVLGVYRAGQAVRRVVSQCDGLILGVDAEDRRNGAEDLLVVDPHVWSD